MTVFEWVLVGNLFMTLYLAYVVYDSNRDMFYLEEMLDEKFQIIGAFMNKVTREKVDAGEWSPHETL